MNTFRNRLAQRIANFALRYIGTADYRNTLDGVIRVGMKTLDDERPIVFDFVKREVYRGNGPLGY